MNYDLNNNNLVLLAAKAYDKPSYIMSEFEEDLKRLKYIKRLIQRYRKSGDVNERLLLNHIIILANIFGVELAVKMLFLKIEKEDFSILKTFLIFLNYLPSKISTINNLDIDTVEIPIDFKLANTLRNI